MQEGRGKGGKGLGKGGAKRHRKVKMKLRFFNAQQVLRMAENFVKFRRGSKKPEVSFYVQISGKKTLQGKINRVFPL
jgi:hypothetical protein